MGIAPTRFSGRSGPRTALAVAALALLAGLPALAQQAAPAQRIAIVDTQRLLEESAPGKDALERLRQLFESRQKDITDRETEINGLRQQLEQGAMSLSEARQSELRRQIEDGMIALRRLRDDAQRELNQQQDRALSEIDRQIMPVIRQVAAEQGYSLIFRKFESGLLFADDGVEITELVLQRFNASGVPAPAEGDGGE